MVEPMTALATTPRAADPLGTPLFVLAVIALALAPTQLTIPVKGIPLHPSEPFLLLAALVWAIRWLRTRDSDSLPPFAHWLLFAAGGLSLFALFAPIGPGANDEVIALARFGAEIGKAAVKGWAMETAQVVLYLLIAVTVYRAVFREPGRLRIAIFALLATTSLAVGLAVVQRALLPSHYQPDPAKRAVFADNTERMTEDEAKAYDGPVQMGVWIDGAFTPCNPALAYVTVETPQHVCSTFGHWGDHGFYPSRMAYAAFLALALPFALVVWLTDRRRWVRLWMALLFAGAAVTVLAGLAVPAILLGLLATGIALGPRAGRAVLVGAVAYGVFVLAVGGLQRGEVLVEPYRPTVRAAEAARLYEGAAHLKKFWGEQYAALNIFRGNPVLGAGNGQYQARIGQAYDVLSPVAIQRLEPDTQNGYLVALVNTGLLGLAAWLALFGLYYGLARRRRENPGDPWAAALFGALAALLLVFFVTNPWVRGTATMIAALLAAIAVGATPSPAARINKKE
ncbi:MAG: hypothetical protein BWY76_00947 [bacterium ADurb.Bin429]|nr:MAG: hypothetical protein BWY76_00947 [bacterium ADurb.Bin429]